MRAFVYFKKSNIHVTDDIPSSVFKPTTELLSAFLAVGFAARIFTSTWIIRLSCLKMASTTLLSNASLPLAMSYDMSEIIAKFGLCKGGYHWFDWLCC